MLGLLASFWLASAPPATATPDPLLLRFDEAPAPLSAPLPATTPTPAADEPQRKRLSKGQRLMIGAGVAYGLGSAIQWTTAGATGILADARPGATSGVMLGMNLGGIGMFEGVVLSGIGGRILAGERDDGPERARPLIAGGATLAALGGGAMIGTAILWPTIRASCPIGVGCNMAAMHLGGAALGVGVGMISYGDRLRDRDENVHRLSKRALTPIIAGSVLFGAGYVLSAGVGMASWQDDPTDDVARRTRNRLLIPVVGPWIHAAGPDAPVFMALVTGGLGALQIGGTIALAVGAGMAGKERRSRRRRVQLSVAPRLDGVSIVGRF